MLESQLVSLISSKLQQLGWVCIKVWGTTYQTKGTPDLLCCFDGLFVAIEVKVGKNTASPAQILMLNKFKKAGAIAVIVNDSNWEEVIKFIMIHRYAGPYTAPEVDVDAWKK